jgi:hypothetical protein
MALLPRDTFRAAFGEPDDRRSPHPSPLVPQPRAQEILRRATGFSHTRPGFAETFQFDRA